MADTIGNITFTNVSLNELGGGSQAFSPATLNIDYTTNTVTVDPSGPALTFNGHTFSSFTLTQQPALLGGAYVLTSGTYPLGPVFELSWSGHSPDAFNTYPPPLAYAGGAAFDGFLHNQIAGDELGAVGGGEGICFAAGSLIRTPGGDVPVENLTAGDLVLTASGEMRPVKWMGHSDVDFQLTPNASQPIRIAAEAFGPARPSQDLYLSAGHSVCVDLLGEVFIPVGYLANGGTIAKVEVDTICYWHVELDSHDVLIANNLPAESYLAMANRGAFEELRGLLPAILEGRDRSHADFCRPVVDKGPVLDFVRQRLTARAEEIGWSQARDANLHLVADGQVIRPLIEDGAAAFLFPASAKDVRLMSNTFSAEPFGSSDPRGLGVMLAGLALSGTRGGEPRRIALDDKRLSVGVYQVENHAGELRRWTNGALVLDPQLWEGLSGHVALLVTYDSATVRGWIAPPEQPGKAEASARPTLRAVA